MSKRLIEEFITVHVNLLGMPFAQYDALTPDEQERVMDLAIKVHDEAMVQITKRHLALPLLMATTTLDGEEFKCARYELSVSELAEMEGEALAHSFGIYTEQQLQPEVVKEFVDLALQTVKAVAQANNCPCEPIHVTRQKAFRETVDTIEKIEA